MPEQEREGLSLTAVGGQVPQLPTRIIERFILSRILHDTCSHSALRIILVLQSARRIHRVVTAIRDPSCEAAIGVGIVEMRRNVAARRSANECSSRAVPVTSVGQSGVLKSGLAAA